MNQPNGVGILSSAYIFHCQKSVINALSRGEIESLRLSYKRPVDEIVSFGLSDGFLIDGLKLFPDSRKKVEIPIEVLQRLHDKHSLLLAPYMLNDADLITKLGYNVKVLSEGFNDRNTHPRKTAFHGEALKHVLLSVKSNDLIQWFNKSWLPTVRKHSPGRTKQYILDGTYSSGYKAVWLQETIDNKGVIVAMSIVPITVHDLTAAKDLIAGFEFEEGSSIIADRGFISAPWITHLKKNVGLIYLFHLDTIWKQRKQQLRWRTVAICGPHIQRAKNNKLPTFQPKMVGCSGKSVKSLNPASNVDGQKKMEPMTKFYL